MSTFQFFAPLSFFEKASAPEGKRKRIAGVISTEDLDKQGEVVVQKGLDFQPFLKEGWFNDNHSKKTADVLGYPEGVQTFQKGERLPDGNTAPTNLTWAEGYLLDTPEGERIWNLGRALTKAGGQRRLGYSLEGSVQKRTGPSGRVVAKAVIRNVAITNCPVGEGTRLETLVKSLTEVEKGLTMGTPTPGTAVTGPKSGEGAGQVLARESLEQDGQARILVDGDDDEPSKLAKSHALARIQQRFGCSETTAERIYYAIGIWKDKGLL